MNTMDVCLIVSIVRKGWAEKVISAAKSHGATGGTTMLGRGVGKSDAPIVARMADIEEMTRNGLWFAVSVAANVGI